MRAYNFQLGRYDEISSGISGASLISEGYWDDPLYEWTAPSRALSQAYWQPGRCTGYRARVKGHTTVGGTGYGMLSWDLQKNSEGCIGRYTNNAEWQQNCAANESEVFTVDHADTPRTFSSSSSGPDPNATCTALEFSFGHSSGWDSVQGSFQSGGTSRALSCSSDPPLSDGRVFGRCRMSLGSTSAVRSTIEALRTTAATVTISARDLRCRDGLRSSASRAIAPSTYDYNWARWSGARPQCSAPPPPPPPPPSPRIHTVICGCADATGTAAATLNACIDTSGGSAVVAGAANLLCGFAERDVERVTGLDTTCRLSSVSGAGASCSHPGNYTITSIAPL